MFVCVRQRQRASLKGVVFICQPRYPASLTPIVAKTCNSGIASPRRWISSFRRPQQVRLSYSRFNVAGIFLGILGVSYGVYHTSSRLLEAPKPSEESESHDTAFPKYHPINPPRSNEQASDILRWEEGSFLAAGSVLRLDHVVIASNLPSEDSMMEAQVNTPQGELVWLFCGIFDGHSYVGFDTSQALKHFLGEYLMRQLEASTSSPMRPNAQESDLAIKRAFLALDHDIMETAAAAVSGPRFLTDAMSEVGPAYAGSCALVSCYNEQSRLLKVACTGDSRAVLGRRNATGGWTAIALSTDQTGHNSNEISRLAREHPGEDALIKDGRVLGLAVSRAFGDSRWKWPRELQERARDRFFGPQIQEGLLTPPYLTAEPVITTTKIEPENGDFVIMASDGLWDSLSNEQAVKLVGVWLQSNNLGREAAPPENTKDPPKLPKPYETGTRINPNAEMAYTTAPRYEEKNTVCIDENAATHLARHALGGNNEDLLSGLLTPSVPHSRSLRDDISVQVIFFGKDPNLIETC